MKENPSWEEIRSAEKIKSFICSHNRNQMKKEIINPKAKLRDTYILPFGDKHQGSQAFAKMEIFVLYHIKIFVPTLLPERFLFLGFLVFPTI